MVVYKGIIKDFKDSDGAEKFCTDRGIIYFTPDKKRMAWLKKWLKTAKLPAIEDTPDVECWFRAYGVWGVYHPDDNCISICPWEIERCGGLELVIKHELIHLQHPVADSMSHEEKEDYINKQ